MPNSQSNIKWNFVSQTEINKIDWDKSINNCLNGNIYAQSKWLDIVSPGWCALISDDYSYLCPLPVKTKKGISYLAQPPFTQQLGVFSSKTISSKDVSRAIKNIPSRFKLTEISFNEFNPVVSGLYLKSSANAVLNLKKSYTELKNNYSTQQIRNISKAAKHNFTIVKAESTIETFGCFLNNKGKNIRGFKTESGITLENLFKNTNLTNPICLVMRNSDGFLLTSIILFQYKKRITLIFTATSEEGRGQGLLSYLIDQVIQEYSGSDFEFDFEGSDYPELMRFYTGFGAETRYYPRVHFYRFPINLLKKTSSLFRK